MLMVGMGWELHLDASVYTRCSEAHTINQCACSHQTLKCARYSNGQSKQKLHDSKLFTKIILWMIVVKIQARAHDTEMALHVFGCVECTVAPCHLCRTNYCCRKFTMHAICVWIAPEFKQCIGHNCYARVREELGRTEVFVYLTPNNFALRTRTIQPTYQMTICHGTQSHIELVHRCNVLLRSSAWYSAIIGYHGRKQSWTRGRNI